jgi:hypothetical protein
MQATYRFQTDDPWRDEITQAFGVLLNAIQQEVVAQLEAHGIGPQTTEATVYCNYSDPGRSDLIDLRFRVRVRPESFAVEMTEREEDITGGQLVGKAIETALEREIRWKDQDKEEAGASPVPPKDGPTGESPPSSGSWRDNPAML